MADFQSVPLKGHKIKLKWACRVSSAYSLLAAVLRKDQPVWAAQFLMYLCSLEGEWGWASVPGAWPGIVAVPGQERGQRGWGWGWGHFQAVQVRLKHRERALTHSLGVPGKRCRDYQRRVRYEALRSQRCYAFCACKLLAVQPLPGSGASQQLFLGALSVLSFRVTSVTALVFVRKKDVFSSGIVILVWSTGGQKTRYSLPQLPLAEQYLWVDSKPVRISKTEALLVCMKVILRASWHCKSTVPWQSSNYAESCWEVIRLLATSICLLLVAQALPAEGATSPVPRCFSEYRISSLGFSGSCGLWVLHWVSKGCELLAALLCTYTTWPQGRNSCLWALWNIPDPYPIINNNNNTSNKLIYINYIWLYILQTDN